MPFTRYIMFKTVLTWQEMAATAYKAGAIAKTSVLDIRAVEHLTERKGSLLIGQDDKFI